MTRILMLTNAIAPDKIGGLERYVRELSAALVARGHEVAVSCKHLGDDSPASELADDGVRVLRHGVPSKKNPFFALTYPWSVRRGVLDAARDFQAEVVHAHYAIPALPLTSARHRQRGFVYTFHAPVYREMLSERNGSYFLPSAVEHAAVRSVRRAEARVVRSARQISILSQFMRDELGALDPVAGARAALIPGGIDVSFLSPGEPYDTGHEGWLGTGPTLFTARRLTPRTGVVELIEAMPIILAKHPGARLVVAGDGALRADVVALVSHLGLQQSVLILGRVSEADLRNWFRRADLTVMPTAALEGFGLTTAESMACGTPAAVTPVGANPELVAGLPPDLLLPDASAQGMAAGISRLLDTPDVLSGLRADVRARAVRQWSWDSVCTRIEGLYAAHRATDDAVVAHG